MKRPRRPHTPSPESESSRKSPDAAVSGENGAKEVDTPLRVIGGKLRGRKLEYSGDPRTRPMKDRVREAVFNLIGPSISGKQAIDLFAGTGALALESISRGAVSAIAIERHFPSADLIKKNGRTLEIEAKLQVLAGDTFIWVKRMFGAPVAGIPLPDLSEGPWAVYFCPPYALYEERLDDMLEIVSVFYAAAPIGSCLIVEADEHFDFATLIEPEAWDVRRYYPAIVGILRKDA